MGEIGDDARATQLAVQRELDRAALDVLARRHVELAAHHLRLALACGSKPEAVKRIFDSLWVSGGNATDQARFAALCGELGVQPQALAEQKDALRRNTEEAAARGVFGVPSFVIDAEVFWGADSLEFAKAFLADRGVLRNDEMRRVDSLPVGAARKP